MNAHKIVVEARQWIGTPFHQQGRQKNVGCDCIGLIIGIAKAIGLTSLTGRSWDECDVINYDCIQDSKLLLNLLPKHFHMINDFNCGDMLLIKISENQYHICLVSNKQSGRIIHACSTIGRVLEQKISPIWKKQIYSVLKYN